MTEFENRKEQRTANKVLPKAALNGFYCAFVEGSTSERKMNDKDTKRLSRLTAILTMLQTKRIVTAPELARKFTVSTRTVYRDIKALEQAGVPILTVEGKGYTGIDGYRIPPIMFTESEANALITVEKLVLKNKDTSLIHEYQFE